VCKKHLNPTVFIFLEREFLRPKGLPRIDPDPSEVDPFTRRVRAEESGVHATVGNQVVLDFQSQMWGEFDGTEGQTLHEFLVRRRFVGHQTVHFAPDVLRRKVVEILFVVTEVVPV
jgi:hypothetical protein